MCTVRWEIVIVASSVWRVHCGVSVTHTCTRNIGFMSSYCDRFHYSVNQWHYSQASAERQNLKKSIIRDPYLPYILLFNSYSVLLYIYMEQSQRKECYRKTVHLDPFESFPYMETPPRSVKFALYQERSLLLPLFLKLVELDMTAVLFIRCISFQPSKASVRIF